MLMRKKINKMVVGMIQKELQRKKTSECFKRSMQGRRFQNDPKEAFKEEHIWMIQKSLQESKSQNGPKEAFTEENLWMN